MADPEKRLYQELGVEPDARALFDPPVWGPILRGVFRSALAVFARSNRSPRLNAERGRFGLPADFLIAPDGRILASNYGRMHMTSGRSRSS